MLGISSRSISRFTALQKRYETPDYGSAQTNKSVTKAAESQKTTAQEEMELFKQEFHNDIAKIKQHSTVKNASVNISERAFEAMKNNPEYRAKVLSLLERDLSSSYAPRDTSVVLTVGESLAQYRGDSWPTGNDSEYWWRSQNSFYRKSADQNGVDEKKSAEERQKLLRQQQYADQLNQFMRQARAISQLQQLKYR